MKNWLHILIIAFTFSCVTSFSQEKGIDLNWQTDFEKVKQLAKKENKKILIYFTGSDWSKACQLLNREFFYTEKFQKIASKKLILLRVNSPRRKELITKLQANANQQLIKKYQQNVYPTIVLTDASGKEINRVESYNYLQDTSRHYKLIEEK